MENLGLEKVKAFFRNFKEILQELENVEYAIRLLERELEEYRELVDKETMLPKARLIKEKISRFIERIKYSPENYLLGIGVTLSVVEELPKGEEAQILNQLAIYLDRRIRPGDLLFKLSDSSLGMIFFVESKEQADTILKRLESILLNLKAQTYSSKKVLVNFKINKVDITPQMEAEQVFEELSRE